MIISVDLNNPDQRAIKAVVNFLAAREIVILPTDTIYGFSCLALNAFALKELGELKDDGLRPRIVLILKDWVERYIAKSFKYERMYKLWPSPLTMVFPAKKGVFPPSLYNADGGIAFRVPATSFLRMILEELDEPIVSTSLNKPGESPLTEPESIGTFFGSRFPLIVVAGELKSLPSTVISCQEFPEIKFLRDGVISREEVNRKLAELGLTSG